VATRPYLSVVVPAYNEQKRIGGCLSCVTEFLGSKEFDSEVIVVDDGSTDRTAEIAKSFAEKSMRLGSRVQVRVISNHKNVGKGFAVARGMQASEGERVLFTDADLSAPIGQADLLLDWIDKGYDIVIGSRRLAGSRVEPQPLYRRAMGLVFGWLTALLVVSGYKDTQCGFKMFTAQAAKAIADRQVMTGFVFDVEQLFIAKRLGLKVKEVPVFWRDNRETKVKVLSDPIRMAIGLVKIRMIHSRLGEVQQL